MHSADDPSFDQFGRISYYLPGRAGVKSLFEASGGLRATCNEPYAIRYIYESIELGRPLVYVLQEAEPEEGEAISADDPYKGFTMVGAIALGHRRDSGHATRSPTSWQLQLRYMTQMNRFTKTVAGRQQFLAPYETLSKMRIEDPNLKLGMTFYFEWVCTANSTGGNPTYGGTGALLVQGLANYIDATYVQPAVEMIMDTTAGTMLRPALKSWPDRASSVEEVELYQELWRAEVVDWVRRRTFFELEAIETARSYWQNVMGFRQIDGPYDIHNRMMARYVFPDLATPYARPVSAGEAIGKTWENHGNPPAYGGLEGPFVLRDR